MTHILTRWPRCTHGAEDDICWQCSHEISEARLSLMRKHMEFILREEGDVSPRTIARSALDEDDQFLNCVKGKHQFIDITVHGDAERRYLPCMFCGAEHA